MSVFESTRPRYEYVWTTPVLRNGYPKTISEEFSCSDDEEDVTVPEAYQSNINAAVSWENRRKRQAKDACNSQDLFSTDCNCQRRRAPFDLVKDRKIWQAFSNEETEINSDSNEREEELRIDSAYRLSFKTIELFSGNQVHAYNSRRNNIYWSEDISDWYFPQCNTERRRRSTGSNPAQRGDHKELEEEQIIALESMFVPGGASTTRWSILSILSCVSVALLH